MKIKNQSNIWLFTNFIKPFHALVLILGIPWLIYNLIPNDYCFGQHRKLTDKEYLSIVLGGRLKSGLMKTHNWDNTIDSYLAHHPDCCRVHRNNYLWKGLVVVQIIYEESDKGKNYNGNTTKDISFYEYLAGLTGCGKILKTTGGG